METSVRNVLNDAAKCMLNLAVEFVTAMFYALALTLLYGWFIQPVFLIGDISFPQVVGIVLFVRLCLLTRVTKEDIKEKAAEIASTTFMETIKQESNQWILIGGLIVLSWVLHLVI